MNISKDRSGENMDDHKKEWLNLSLGPYLEAGPCSSSRPTTSTKGYRCSFCGRKFFSPQALGGHQNGHRREREAARRYRSFQINQSIINVHSTLLVGTPAREGKTNVTRFTDNGPQYGVACVQGYAEDESVELKWPGSFHLNPPPVSEQSDASLLDLDLKL